MPAGRKGCPQTRSRVAEGCPQMRSRVAPVSGHPRLEPGSRTPLQQQGLRAIRHSESPRALRDIVREAPPAEPVPVAVPGPVDEEGLALDLVALDEAPVATVLRVVPVVTHYEIRVGRHDRGLAAVRVAAEGVAAAHAGVRELGVELDERLAVDQDLMAADLHALAGRRDDPLDEVALLVLRVLEHDDVAAPRVAELRQAKLGQGQR